MKKLSSSVLALLLGCASCGVSLAAPEPQAASSATTRAICSIDRTERAVLSGTPSPRVRALLTRYVEGGDALTEDVTGLLADPALTADVVAIARTASPEQRIAIARGIVMALSRVAPDSVDARAIRSALRCADPDTRAVIAYLENRLYARSLESDGRRGPMYIEGVSGFGAAGGYLPPSGPKASPN